MAVGFRSLACSHLYMYIYIYSASRQINSSVQCTFLGFSLFCFLQSYHLLRPGIAHAVLSAQTQSRNTRLQFFALLEATALRAASTRPRFRYSVLQAISAPNKVSVRLACVRAAHSASLGLPYLYHAPQIQHALRIQAHRYRYCP